MAKCIICGKELPQTWSTKKCLDCSRKAVMDLFKENPQVAEAFHENIEKMKKPENMKKIVDNTCRFMAAIQALQRRGK